MAAGLVGEGAERGQVVGGGCGLVVEGGVGQDRAAVGVEHDVVGGDAAVGQAAAVEVVEGVRERAQQGDELAGGEGAAAV
ncbi:hypothetical protein [Kribbella antiqua]|uniref:hypothetical protein n=1 Tax=Kribbella antiqua TaxID=2512217 RepID=UPI001F54600A|nr:hypothetical protein [Kribbella antiqua]